MKNKKKYVKPTGRLLMLVMENCLCNSSVPGGDVDDDILIGDWEDGEGGYGSGDL